MDLNIHNVVSIKTTNKKHKTQENREFWVKIITVTDKDNKDYQINIYSDVKI